MNKVTLYHYWRSSSSWRVRFALELKKVKAEMVHVSLLNGESESPAHLARHPLGYVPVLEVGRQRLIESVAIIEWLDENFIDDVPRFYPTETFERAHVRTLIEIINSTMQPLQNLTVIDYYSDDKQKQKAWIQHFLQRGFSGFEVLCRNKAGRYSFGDLISAADLFLLPQCHAAERFDVDLSAFPTVERLYGHLLALPEAKRSSPKAYEPPS